MAAKATAQAEIEQTPREKFTRLGSSRTTKALAAISLIEQLANRQRYEYTETDVDQIESALTKAVESAVSSLRAGKVQTATFSLGG
jgi:hypothetical protein